MRVPPALAAAGCLLALLAAGASPLAAQLPTPPVRRELRVGAPGVPAALDPAAALEGPVPVIARHVFDTLVGYRQDGTDVEPALATSWSASRDGLTWSFRLRDGVRFHDGTSLTATEVVAAFERHLRPDPQAPSVVWPALLRGTPGVVKEVRAPDPRTVQFVLVQPYAPLPTVLAHPGLAVARQIHGPDGAVRFVGSGPYRVVDASPGRIAVEAVPGHWGGGTRAERIVFLDVASDEHAEAELDARSLDVWFPAAPPRRAEGALALPGPHIGYLAFQTEREPFSKKKLRQAVAAALDPAVIGLALERVGVPLQSFLPPGIWARREGSSLLGGTRETVKALLAEGGWLTGLRPTLLAPTESAGLNVARLAEAIQLMLGAADVPIQLRVVPPDVARAARQAGEHDLTLAEAGAPGGDPHFLLFPLSTSEGASKGPRALNYSFYRNPRLDDVLIRASQLSFRPERHRLYQRAQAVLAEEMPWIPLYVRVQWAVARPEVRGLRLHPTGFHRLDTVVFDHGGAPR